VKKYDLERSITQFFATSMGFFLELSPEMQKHAINMVNIINSRDASEDEKFSSLATLQDMLFPPLTQDQIYAA